MYMFGRFLWQCGTDWIRHGRKQSGNCSSFPSYCNYSVLADHVGTMGIEGKEILLSSLIIQILGGGGGGAGRKLVFD